MVIESTRLVETLTVANGCNSTNICTCDKLFAMDEGSISKDDINGTYRMSALVPELFIESCSWRHPVETTVLNTNESNTNTSSTSIATNPKTTPTLSKQYMMPWCKSCTIVETLECPSLSDRYLAQHCCPNYVSGAKRCFSGDQ